MVNGCQGGERVKVTLSSDLECSVVGRCPCTRTSTRKSNRPDYVQQSLFCTTRGFSTQMKVDAQFVFIRCVAPISNRKPTFYLGFFTGLNTATRPASANFPSESRTKLSRRVTSLILAILRFMRYNVPWLNTSSEQRDSAPAA